MSSFIEIPYGILQVNIIYGLTTANITFDNT